MKVVLQKVVTISDMYGERSNFLTYNHLDNSLGGYIKAGWILKERFEPSQSTTVLVFERYQ